MSLGKSLNLREVSPRYLLEKTFSPEEKGKTIREIYEVFLKTPGLLLPLSEGVVVQAVINGVRAGMLEVKIGERSVIGETLSERDLFPDTPVLRPEVAHAAISEPKDSEVLAGFISTS